MHGRRDQRSGRDRRRDVDVGSRVLQGLLALWLLSVPVVLPGPNQLVTAKDVVVGGVLLTLTVAAASGRAVRRVENTVVVLLGTVLIVASVLLEFGPAAEATARQWSEVVVGVLLLCVAGVRAR